MANKKSVQAWFKKANEDLFAARFLHSSKSPKAFVPIAFHCQQVIEKSLKGFLTFHSKKIEKTHDLKEVLSWVIEIDASLEKSLKDTPLLTPFAVAYSYPDALIKDLSLADVDSFIKMTDIAYNEILSRIPFDSVFDGAE